MSETSEKPNIMREFLLNTNSDDKQGLQTALPESKHHATLRNSDIIFPNKVNSCHSWRPLVCNTDLSLYYFV